MGVIRGILIVIVSVLLFFSIFATGVLGVLTSSLEYENVEKEASSVLKDIFVENLNFESYLDELSPIIEIYCQNNTEYVFSYGENTFNIPCDVVMQDQTKIIDEGVKDIIYNIYYDDYNCDFFDCLQEGEAPYFIISQKSHDFFESKLYLLVLVSILISILDFFLIKNKGNFPLVAGILVVVSALPLMKLSSIFGLFDGEMLMQFLKIFFSQSYAVSITMIVIGVILVAIGIIFKVFKLGFFLSKVFGKLSKFDPFKKWKKSPQEISKKREEKPVEKIKSK